MSNYKTVILSEEQVQILTQLLAKESMQALKESREASFIEMSMYFAEYRDKLHHLATILDN